jgi:hypothetical protein
MCWGPHCKFLPFRIDGFSAALANAPELTWKLENDVVLLEMRGRALSAHSKRTLIWHPVLL